MRDKEASEEIEGSLMTAKGRYSPSPVVIRAKGTDRWATVQVRIVL